MKKVTIHSLAKNKADGVKTVMITAYDATFARMVDQAGVDVILVGDSLGNVIQGQSSTLPVTMEQMIYHCAAVNRGSSRAQIVGDMPFMSYQVSVEEAVRNAGRLVAEGGAEAVKLEGGREFCQVVKAIGRAGIPVMGHLGLTPQAVHKLGGYRIQGKSADARAQLMEDAIALQEAGAYALVLEGVPGELAGEITAKLHIPTIGIGAGVACDGQVLVSYDMLGMNPDFTPKFLKRYLEGYALMMSAVEGYAREVREGVFPSEAHTFHSPVPVVSSSQRGLEPVSHDDEPRKIYG